MLHRDGGAPIPIHVDFGKSNSWLICPILYYFDFDFDCEFFLNLIGANLLPRLVVFLLAAGGGFSMLQLSLTVAARVYFFL